MYPSDFHYTEDHEWLHVEGEECTFGITDYAQGELGEVVYVDLPEIGDEFDAGDSVGAIDSSKTSADVYTPVAGEVIAINEELEDAPEKVNEDPHGDGWLFKLKISPTDDGLEGLMSAEAYGEFAGKQD